MVLLWECHIVYDIVRSLQYLKANTALHLFVLMYLTDTLVKGLKLEGIFYMRRFTVIY